MRSFPALGAYRILWVISLLFLLPERLYAQNPELDSLTRIWSSSEANVEERFDALMLHSGRLKYVDNEGAMALAVRAMELTHSTNSLEHVSRAHTQIGILLFFSHRHDSAAFHVYEGNRLARKSGNKAIMANALTNVALYYFQISKFELGKDSALKAIEYSLESEDSILILRCYNNAGALYWTLSDYIGAMDQFLAALTLAKAIGDHTRIQNLYSNIGKCYAELHLYEEAINHYKSAQALIRPDEYWNQAVLSNNIGEAYDFSGQKELARTYYKRVLTSPDSIAPCIRTNAQINLIRLSIEEGRIAYAEEQMDSLYEHADRCPSLFIGAKRDLYAGIIQVKLNNYGVGIDLIKKSYPHLELLSSQTLAHEALVSAYKESGQIDSAFRQIEKLLEVSKERREVDQSIGIAQAEYQYKAQLEEEQQRVELLELESKVLKAEKSTLALWIGAVGVLIFSIVLLFFYHRQRSARRVLEEQNRTITIQQDELQIKANLLGTSYSRIQELSDFRERLAHMAVHDMKNPLHNVIGLASLKPSKENLSQIKVASQQMLNFLTNMLDIYKFEQAHISLHIQELSVKEVIKESIAQVSPIAQARKINIECNCPEHLIAHVDESIMVRVLVNVLTNAIKYSPDESEITINTEKTFNTQKEEGLRIEVRDQGMGMDQKTKDALFKDIKDRSSMHINKSHSTGIGLNFCQLAQQAHGGTIEISSEPNAGTTVRLFLPFHSTENTTKPAKPEEIAISEENLVKENEVEVLIQLATKLQEYKVYEVGSITRLLSSENSDKLSSPWVAELRTAVYIGNSDQYDLLINMMLER